MRAYLDHLRDDAGRIAADVERIAELEAEREETMRQIAAHVCIPASMLPEETVTLLGRPIGTVQGRAKWDREAVVRVLGDVEANGVGWLGDHDPNRPIRVEIEGGER
jgi:hypothetical protein